MCGLKLLPPTPVLPSWVDFYGSDSGSETESPDFRAPNI